jgi:hypothetical protein
MSTRLTMTPTTPATWPTVLRARPFRAAGLGDGDAAVGSGVGAAGLGDPLAGSGRTVVSSVIGLVSGQVVRGIGVTGGRADPRSASVARAYSTAVADVDVSGITGGPRMGQD